MNIPNLRHLLLPLALAGALSTHADEPKAAPAAPAEPHQRHLKVVVRQDDTPGPLETVTFLGVETVPADPTLAAQLGLADGVGLVVRRLVDGSPAQSVLKEHDILTKLDDQILVDQRQLSVLVRGKKAGDEVALTLCRGGKVITVKTKLVTHEVPKMAKMEGFGPDENFRFFHGGMPGMEGLQNLPGTAREDVDRIVRMLGREHRDLMARPQVRIIARSKGDGSTTLNLNEGNLVFTDDEGTVEIKAHEGKRELTLKSPKGDVTFQGPIASEEDRKKLPPESLRRLEKIEKIQAEGETDEDFDQEGAAIGQPRKTRIHYRMNQGTVPPAPPSF